MKEILLTICARGGSKGIPGKNIKPLNGLPLIGHSIKVGKAFALKNQAYMALSSDNVEIKNVAEKLGLKCDYTRPKELATDTAGKISAIRDLLKFEEDKQGGRFQYIIDMDVTSPLRTVTDLENALDVLKNDPQAINIFSVSPASRNPYFNMVEKKENGYYNVVKKPERPIKSRQMAPRVFDMNASFYVYKRLFFDISDQEVAKTNKSLIYEVPHICFDLDEAHDFTIMEIMIRERLLNFEF